VFWSLLQDHPGVMVKVARMLTATIRSLSERLFELSTLGIQNRVHAEVLRLAREVGIERNAATIDPAPRHDEIAARISTNREQVTKELSAMQRRGLIVKSRRALIVPDVARLEQLVLEVAGGS
jgi:CRP/FNR family cyclic AMP-dependent transcriptional regulator